MTKKTPVPPAVYLAAVALVVGDTKATIATEMKRNQLVLEFAKQAGLPTVFTAWEAACNILEYAAISGIDVTSG